MSSATVERRVKRLGVAALAIAAVVPWFGRAASPVSLVSFSNGTVANAADMNANFSALSAALAAQARWTPIDPGVSIGSLPNSGTTVAYDLPAAVPANATEVLVYARCHTGSTSPAGGREYRFHTVDETDATKLYAKYLYAYAYGQDAVPYSSANMWLPVTAQRKIHVTRTVGGTISGSFSTDVRILGWR